MRPVRIISAVLISLLFVVPAHAGDVKATVRGKTLTLKGDGQGAELTLMGGGSPDSVFVAPSGGTTVNGSSFTLMFFNISNVSMSFGGNGGADVVCDNLELDGSISFKGGSGSQQLAITGSQIGGNVGVNGSSGIFDFTCTESEIGGKLALKTGTGPDFARISCTVTGSVSANLGDGANTLQVTGGAGTISVGSLALKTGRGDDDLTLESVGVEAAAKVDLGGGNNHAQLSALSIFGNLAFTGKGDDDTVSGDTLGLTGNVSFSLGSGANTLSLLNSVLFHDLSISAGSGDDQVVLGPGLTIDGKKKIHLGRGSNQLEE